MIIIEPIGVSCLARLDRVPTVGRRLRVDDTSTWHKEPVQHTRPPPNTVEVELEVRPKLIETGNPSGRRAGGVVYG